MMERDDYDSHEALNQAFTSSEHLDAIFSFSYLDDDSNSVNITQMYNITDESMAMSAEQCVANDQLQWEESWSDLNAAVAKQEEALGACGGADPSACHLTMSDEFTKTELYHKFLDSVGETE